MVDKVTIINRGLIAIGSETILSPTDDNKRAKLANSFYNEWRDEELSGHHWNFATKRTTLAKLASAPDWGYDSQFQVPPDFLKLQATEFDEDPVPKGFFSSVSTQETPFEYKVEDEGKILANGTDTLKIRYTARVVDETKWPAYFSRALSARIAVELAVILQNDQGLRDRMEVDYLQKVRMAKFYDATEGSPYDLDTDEWLGSRS